MKHKKAFLLFSIVLANTSCSLYMHNKAAMTFTEAERLPKDVALKYLEEKFKYTDVENIINKDFIVAEKNSYDFCKEAYGDNCRKPGTTTCQFNQGKSLLIGTKMTTLQSGSDFAGTYVHDYENKIIGKLWIENVKLRAVSINYSRLGDGEVDSLLRAYASEYGTVTIKAKKMLEPNGQECSAFSSNTPGYQCILASCEIYLDHSTPLKKVGAALNALGIEIGM
ncbi:MAG: hypothetical protein ACKN9T_06865 [Candidatus Methylumidiphilus sp.]